MRSATIIALIALSTFAACAKKEAPVEAAPADLSVEPTQTGKYK
jgi:predicted small lipoprotein YifL